MSRDFKTWNPLKFLKGRRTPPAMITIPGSMILDALQSSPLGYQDLNSADLVYKRTAMTSKKRGLAKVIRRTLTRVPDWSETWQGFTGDEFFPQLVATPPEESTPPRIHIV